MKFSSKIFIYIFIFSAIIISGLISITHLWIQNHHLESHIGFEKEVANLVSLKSEDYILKNDLIALYNFYQSIIEVDKRIDYIFIQKEKEVLVHTLEKGVPKALISLPPVKNPDGVSIIPVEDNYGNIIYHYRIFLETPANTVLHLGVSKKKINEDLIEHRNLMIAVGLLLLAIVPFSLALFMSKRLSKPLKLLQDSVRRIGKGDLDYRIEMKSYEEIEALANDINSMTAELEKSHKELEDEVSGRIQMEDILAERTELLNNIISNIPHSIFWKDRHFKYRGCNRVFAKAAGLKDTEEISGKTDYEMPWKETADRIRESDEKILETGEAINDFEMVVVDTKGHDKDIIVSKVLLNDSSGNIFGILGISFDLTERKHIEEILKQTQKMEAIGTLAGGIAHDFNNILGVIIGYTELAKDEIDPKSEAYNYLEMVGKSSMRAKELVRQILTFSRKSQEQRRPLQLSTLIKEEAKMLRSTLPSTIEIILNINDESDLISADITQMQQILMNLCTNAAHAMQEKGGTLEISLNKVNITPETIKKYHNISPGPYLELKISDTGTGIDSRILHRIFEPFFTTKENGEGTGMGLAVVHGIVKDHNGDIIVESQPGSGTTFTILLPGIVKEENNENTPFYSIQTGNERVLFIDDESMLLSLGENVLKSLGYQVTSVGRSLEALEVYQKSPDLFDIVITDQTMPHMTGFDLSGKILEINPSAKIILCTGYSDSLNPEKVKNAGIRKLCYKPMTKKDIAMLIRQVLDN